MNDIDRYLDQACRQVSGPDSLRQHLRKELKEHLEEAMDALVAEGMSQDDATAKAIEDLGDPEIISEGMQSVYGPGVTSLFVEQAIRWKDRKWQLAAQIGSLLIIALAASVIYLTFVKVVPSVEKLYSDSGTEFPAYMSTSCAVAEIVLIHWNFVFLISFIGGLGLFEWKCKSENRAQIRTVIGVGTSLVVVAIAFWSAVATMVSLVLLSP
ncbi:MAG: permease prefix domain 1-containing protein [SAR202 cluster bacterium]|jgi:type II secretory pathway component PulF|nr:permease prefix domain 1-containing protein [Planctomycetota bacterium]MDP6513050.1 permease prefix domain 1-containing protein [SAR202 cluster bacterium]